jgi:hypothetical protein
MKEEGEWLTVVMRSITPRDPRQHSEGINGLKDYRYLTGINIKYNKEYR